MKLSQPRFGTFFEGQYARRTGDLDLAYQPLTDLRKLRNAGVTTVCMQLYETYSGTLFYDSKKFPLFRESSQRDFLGETIDAARKLDMKVWVWSAEKGMPLGGAIYEEFRDCVEIDQSGNPLATWDHNFICMCINSRWREFLRQVYEEVLTSYRDIECIIVSDEVGYNDAVRWGGYCPNCIDRFVAKYGQEPPRSQNWLDGNNLWRSFVKERSSWWVEYVSDLASTVKRTAPDVSTAIIMNWFAMTTLLKAADPWALMDIPDVDMIGSDLFYRVFEHDHPTYQSWVGSLMQALARKNEKKVFLTSAAYRTVCPDDIVVGTADVCSNNNNPVFFYNLRHLCDRQPNLEAVRRVSTVSRRVSEYFPDLEPDEGAALLFPRYLWEQHYCEDSLQLLSELTGMYQCLTLAGIPTRIIFEDELSELNRYYLVVVPELLYVPEKTVAALEAYTTGGGVLFLSLQNSVGPQSANEVGLWKLFGVEYKGQTPPIHHLRSNNRGVRAINGKVPQVSLPVYEWPVVQHQLFGGFPSVSHRRAQINLISDQSEILLFGQDAQRNKYPVMVQKGYGNGAAILCSESLGANFNSYLQKCAGHPSIWLTRAMLMRDFLRGVILNHVQPAMPATVETKGNVAAYFKKGEQGYAVYLVNHEYTEPQQVKVTLSPKFNDHSVDVLFDEGFGSSWRADGQVIEVKIQPTSVAVVCAHGKPGTK